MKLSTPDFLMTRFAGAASGMLKMLAELETDALGDRLQRIRLDRPTFIAGLARAGTTVLLELFAQVPEVGTHRYRDFPFLFVPYWWNRYQDRFARREAPVERPHRDRILISKESPDAFEEPIWSHFFPSVHCPDSLHRLTAEHANPDFDRFYCQHLRKILLVRNARRYVSKGNYNVARIEYLARLLPDARFVIPIRHPLDHVRSLVQQHELFSAYDADDRRVAHYLRSAGHYEFGPQRVPINLDAESDRRTLQAWRAGRENLGYASLWRSVYSHLADLTRGPLGDRITIVRYEDLCASPVAVLSKLFDFCELEQEVDSLLQRLPPISAPRHVQSSDVDDEVWQETGELAESFGYQRRDRH
jgi:hypothetical protein